MNADLAWRNRLIDTITEGERVSPRGQPCLELRHVAVEVLLEASLLACPARRLSYRFAAAEALWILDGSDQLAELTPYNARMAEFSDDGVTLAGAYGPRLAPQLGWCVDRLVEDRDTRQAVASVWTPRPAPSRDVPCTLALTFMIRADALDCHAFMRSSDVWLGLPYDLFSFSQVALVVLARFNAQPRRSALPGNLYLTAASSHLYERNLTAADAVLRSPFGGPALVPLRDGFTENDVRERLKDLRARGREALA